MTSPRGMLQPLSPDLAVVYERAFMERLAGRIEEAESFGRGPDGAEIKGSAKRDSALSRNFSVEVDRILRAEKVFDPVVCERLPKGVRTVWHILSGNILSRHAVLRVSAAVAHPYRELALGLTPMPLASKDAGRWMPADAPEAGEALGVVLSTSGWRDGGEDPSLILFEPAPGGGFMARGSRGEDLPRFLALASEEELKRRVLEYVSRERVRLVMDGLELRSTSAEICVPESLVKEAFVTVAGEEEFMRVAEEDGTLVLRRA